MKPRIIKTKVGEYEVISWSGKNTSGIYPANNNVLVLVDQVPEKTAGGIMLTASTRDVNTAAVTTGVIVSASPAAFAEDWFGRKPKIGDRIVFTRYAGEFEEGIDGLKYRIIPDSTIGAFFIDDAEDPRVKEYAEPAAPLFEQRV